VRTIARFIALGLIGLCIGSRVRGEETQPVSVRSVAFTPDGNHLLVGYGTREAAGGLLIWNVKEKRAERKLDTKTGVHSLSFSKDGKLLALAAYDRPPRLLQWPGLEVTAEMVETRRGPIALARDGSLLVMGSAEGNIHCWDVVAKQDRQTLKGQRETYTVAVAPDAQRVAAAGRDGVLVWDVISGEEKLRLKHGSSLTSAVLFSPDGQWILTGGWDNKVRIWAAENGSLRARIGWFGGYDRLAYAPEHNLLAGTGTGNIVGLYQLNLATPPAAAIAQVQDVLRRFDDDSYAVREAATAEVLKIGFLGEAELGKAMQESSSTEVRIRARRAREKVLSEPLVQFNEHTARTRCVSISPSGTLLATGADDGTLRLWDIPGRKQIDVSIPADVQSEK